VQYEQGADGKPRVTGLLLAKAGQQQLATLLLIIWLLLPAGRRNEQGVDGKLHCSPH
jgi:hypothetical protein